MAGEGPGRQGRESGAPRASTLLRAVQRGDYGVLTNLLGSSNSDDHDGNANLGLLAALLVEACGREHLDCIELLLQKMMKPSPKRNLKRRGYFPMHTAAGAGATESIELLLSAGLSPKTRDRSGRTPLHLAAAQGSAECVALLCAVARSTVVSRDRATGDTPVHFAVRARNGVCIEVLRSYAQGGYDIFREANARGETPLDIANALGDASLILRPRRATRGTGRACSEGGVDIQRIMAVWERFFENAAVACVDKRDTTRVTGAPSRNQHGQLVNDHLQTAAKTREASGRVQPNDQMATARIPINERRVVTTAWGSDARAGGEITIRSGDEETGWNESDANMPGLAPGRRDLRLSRLQPGTTTVERARICSWEAVQTNPVDDQEGERLGGSTRQQPTPQQRATGELQVQLENEERALSSDDVDLHLFQTPRGDSDAEVVWLSESHQGEINSTSEPPAENESSHDAATAAGSSLHRRHTWIACWDATSESIYYQNSESGESTWHAPASTDGVHEFQSCVWDPQREAFFTVDENGTAHWLTGSTIEGRAAIDEAASPSATVPPGEVANYGTADSGSTGSTTRSSWQGFGVTMGVAEDSPSTETAGFRDNLHVTLAEEAAEESATGSAILQQETERKDHGLRLSQYSLAEPDYQPVGQLPDCLNGCDYPGQQSSAGTSNGSPQEDAGHKYEARLNAGEERPGSFNTAAASNINRERDGEEDTSDGVEFFDSRTFEDHCQLSAWVLWCAGPSHQDDDGPPYFVNEETGTSSWVLPPEAVATSRGWLRAWSEQHQAWFYANQWTGRVTWESRDLEAEGVVESSARVES